MKNCKCTSQINAIKINWKTKLKAVEMILKSSMMTLKQYTECLFYELWSYIKRNNTANYFFI